MHPRALSGPLLGSLAALALAPAAALAHTQVELRPAAGPAGTAMILDGSGFPAAKRVRVGMTGGPRRSVSSSRTGAFTARLTVPRGRHGWLSIVSHSGQRRVVNRFRMSAAAAASSAIEIASSAGERVRLSSTNAGGRLTLRLSGSGFKRRERLTIRVAGVTHRVTARANGRFAATLALAGTHEAGSFPLVVAGPGARLSFRVAVVPSSNPLTSGAPALGGAGLTPAPALPAPATKPAATGAPTVTGVAQSGQTLSLSQGAWSGTAPLTLASQWQRCDSTGAGCAPIPGATSAGYTATDADVGSTLRGAMTATNSAGSATATSDPTAVVQAAPTPPANTVLPKVSGTPQDGQTVKTSKGTWTGTQPITYSYRWQRCDPNGANCVVIAGATSSSYAVTGADVGGTLRATVTAANGGGSASATSGATTHVQPQSVASDVVALWHMDETSGGVMNDSAGGHTGTLNSVQLGQPGYQALAYGFNGSSSYVSVPSAPDLDPGDADVTITIHMKSSTLPDAGQDEDWDLIRKGVYASSPGEYKMEYYPDGQASCGFKGVRPDSTTGYAEVKGGPALDDGQWHTIQCVKTATQVKTVVDGDTVAFKNIAIGYISSTDGILIGAHSSTSELFQGSLDEASVTIG